MNAVSHHPIFNLGFRIFFAAASLFAATSILFWIGIYNGTINYAFENINAFQWHAHEMIYGYTVAVIAGFLLTAVKNWTGIQTPHGLPLKRLFYLWLGARVLWLVGFWAAGEIILYPAALLDLCFLFTLLYCIAQPIIKRKQWRQMAVLSKLIIITIGNSCFYLQALGWTESGLHISLYAGLYVIVGLILTIGRRIIPPFTERGVSYQVTLYNSRVLDISSMLVFLAFFISALFFKSSEFSYYCAALMIIITSIRLIGWYTRGIWQSPLLWSFFASLMSINLGFVLYLLEPALSISPYLSVHAFALGTIGIMTMGMMGRVSIGHTGRNIKQPPKELSVALALLTIGVFIRTICPVIFPAMYTTWINISAGLWLIAFGLFSLKFIAFWTSPRPDGKYG